MKAAIALQTIVLLHISSFVLSFLNENWLTFQRKQAIAGLQQQRTQQQRTQQQATTTTTTTTTSSEDPATIETRLKDALVTMKQVMSPDIFTTFDPVLKQLHAKILKSVEVRDSFLPGAGQGLVATKNLKAGSLVSFYPAHALGIDSESPFVTLQDDAEYFTKHPPTSSSYLHCTDQPLFDRTSVLGNNNQDALYLDVNPQRDILDSPIWVSQMINDGAVITENTEQGVLEYYRRSGAARNCIHIPFGPSPILATVTTKKVKKGQELLTSYGGTYWLGVWLNLHGQEGVPVTPAIQTEIRTTASELLQCITSVKTTHAAQIQALAALYASTLRTSS